MSFAVVAAYPSLTEAQIACGALRAAGLRADVLDQNFGGVMPTDLLGGFRLVVPEDERVRAKAVLAQILSEAQGRD